MPDSVIAEYRLGAFDAIRRTFVFSGRSTRTELIGYYVLSMLIGIAVDVAFGFFADPLLESRVAVGLGWVLMLPMVGLLVRRLHDQDKSAKAAWLLAFPAFYNAVGDLASVLGATEGRIAADRILGYAYWPMLACTIVLLVLYLLAGTPGLNRFGPDPRGRE